jgi:SNF2 family DNA or RNA helicase
VDIDDMNQKIRLLTIEEIIKTVKKDKRSKIRDIESKIKYHELAIRSVTEKIEESRQEIKKFQDTKDDLVIIDVTPKLLHDRLSSPMLNSLPPPGLAFVSLNHATNGLTAGHDLELNLPTIAGVEDNITNTTNNSTGRQMVHDIRDVRDVIRSRKRRLERMIKRRDQLLEEKRKVEHSMGFFESKVDGVKQQQNNPEQCPICMTQPANVITQCGHMFCRVCIIKCLKKKYQCPLCKTTITPTDAHEIKADGTELSTKEIEEKVLRYGTKLTRILELVRKIMDQREKVVLFVQWTPLMNCIKEIFRECKIDIGVMAGNVMQQNSALKKFKTGNVSVLMGSVDNTGLDLVNANHLIFVHALFGDEYVIQATENQAIARIHRTGQRRKVHIYWFISRGTIEERTYLQTRCG